jgi:putative hydrolase of the HAD superfamily
VCFDLDNTLADREAAFSRWATAFAAQHGIDGPGARWLIAEDQDGSRRREEYFAAVKGHFSLTPPVEDLLNSYRANYPRCYRRERLSVAAITRLRLLGCKVAVVTNGEPSQADKIERIGIAEIVDAVCISSVVGARKPETAIFAEAARKCEVPLSGWMIGDSPDADIRGGKASGLSTIWLRRGRQWSLSDLGPDFSVSSVAEASAVVARSLTL